MVRKNKLETWTDDRIDVSRVWNQEIDGNQGRAEFAVRLISADFLASDYVVDVELPRLVQRRVPLICVPAGPCAWHDVEDLSRVQWALPPDRPLCGMSAQSATGP